MLQREVLIRKFLGAVDCPGAGAIAIDEVTTLDHKVLDLRNDQHRSAV